MAISMPTLRKGVEAGIAQTTTRNDQAGSFIQLVVASIVLIVGILIFNEINASLPESSGGINSTLVVGDISNAMELAPIVLLVIVASIVLAQVSGFGLNQR
jgi:glycerol uptake facilitator-like aquaporin